MDIINYFNSCFYYNLNNLESEWVIIEFNNSYFSRELSFCTFDRWQSPNWNKIKLLPGISYQIFIKKDYLFSCDGIENPNKKVPDNVRFLVKKIGPLKWCYNNAGKRVKISNFLKYKREIKKRHTYNLDPLSNKNILKRFLKKTGYRDISISNEELVFNRTSILTSRNISYPPGTPLLWHRFFAMSFEGGITFYDHDVDLIDFRDPMWNYYFYKFISGK